MGPLTPFFPTRWILMSLKTPVLTYREWYRIYTQSILTGTIPYPRLCRRMGSTTSLTRLKLKMTTSLLLCTSLTPILNLELRSFSCSMACSLVLRLGSWTRRIRWHSSSLRKDTTSGLATTEATGTVAETLDWILTHKHHSSSTTVSMS